MNYCPNCKYWINTNQNYKCPACGHKFWISKKAFDNRPKYHKEPEIKSDNKILDVNPPTRGSSTFIAILKAVGILILIIMPFAALIAIISPSFDQESNVNESVATPTKPPCYRPEVDTDNLTILINEYRIGKNLPQIARETGLDAYANARSYEMFQNKKLTHESKYGDYYQWRKGFPANRKGQVSITWEGHANDQPFELYLFPTINEDIAQTSPGLIENACDIVNGWESSPTHNFSLIDPKNTYMGIGVSANYVALELASEPQ